MLSIVDEFETKLSASIIPFDEHSEFVARIVCNIDRTLLAMKLDKKQNKLTGNGRYVQTRMQ